uniref:DAO domain-containing protein n=1 Tax=Macrostomum lignano TaxID=282301 RepID=A0A1I8FFG5_9PLAT
RPHHILPPRALTCAASITTACNCTLSSRRRLTNSSLRLITTPTRMDEARYQMSRAAWCQAEQHLVGPEKCLELCPLLNMSTVLGGIYNPGDGHIDPYSVTMALAAGARKYGAELYQNSQVRATSQDSKGIWTIVTDHGELKSKHLVNAAGFHARDVGKLTSSPKLLPEVGRTEARAFLYCEKQGLLVGPYESAENMMLCTDWYDNGELFEPDLGRIMPHLERAMEMVPAMQNAEIQSVISGPITYNAENAGLIGPVEGGAELLAGLGYGIIHGGGVGKYVAGLDSLLANRRTAGGPTGATRTRRAARTYGLNNAVGYPKEERFAGRPTKRAAQTSALYDELKSAGAEFGFHNGWEQPHWFGLTEEERRYEPSFRRGNWFPAMQREWRRSAEPGWRPRAGEFLDLVTANRLPKVNRTCITHIAHAKGPTDDGQQKFRALTGSGSEMHDLIWLKDWRHKLRFQDGASRSTTSRIRSLPVCKPVRCPVKFFTAIDGVDCLAIRISYTGELGWELYCGIGELPRLYKSIWRFWTAARLVNFGSYAMNSLRLEKGFAMWGAEMNLRHWPIGGWRPGHRRLVCARVAGKSCRGKLRSERRSRMELRQKSVDVDPEGERIRLVGGKRWSANNDTPVSYSFSRVTDSPLHTCPQPGRPQQPSWRWILLGRRVRQVVLSKPPLLPEGRRERRHPKWHPLVRFSS